MYDPSFIAKERRDSLQQYFNTLPIAILELKDGEVTILRCNRSYREFVQNEVGINMRDEPMQNVKLKQQPDPLFMDVLKRCGTEGETILLNNGYDNKATINGFVRRIAVNPVTGAIAIAAIVLSVNH